MTELGSPDYRPSDLVAGFDTGKAPARDIFTIRDLTKERVANT